ncbi:MAG TPA: hypothetical protein VGN01_01180 [Acidobacteriaceae bacterium]
MRFPLHPLPSSLALVLFLALNPAGWAQADAGASSGPAPVDLSKTADETAGSIGVTSLLGQLRTAQAQRTCDSAAGAEELALRQQLMESVVATSLDVDGVLAEIANERTDLSELRATLEARRDRTVGLLNAANLITGTGLGIAVNAMQFSTSTANLGDGIGVGSGIASTVLSIVGIRRQNGPQHGVGAVPNMLAPLFDAKPALNTYYPPEVLRYLQSVPPTEDAARGTRLDQLMAQWTRDGRLVPPGSPKRDQKVASLTASMNKSIKVSIGDLADRSAMLGDVSGRVALMKRDMAAMMRSYLRDEHTCKP